MGEDRTNVVAQEYGSFLRRLQIAIVGSKFLFLSPSELSTH
jgi:hypothetical protein